MSRLVLLASYPKSGNTWVRAAVDSLAQGGAAVDINAMSGAGIAATRVWFDDFMGVDGADLSDAELFGLRGAMNSALAAATRQRLFVKTHDAWHPPDDCAPPFAAESVEAVVYIIRDPRDVAVSWADHLGCDLDTAIARMADPQDSIGRSKSSGNPQLPQFLSSWSLHVQGWLEAPGLLRHVMRYEEMRADPAAAFRALAHFLDLPATPAAIAGTVAATDFEALRAQETQAGFRDRPARMERFFRRGRAGGWRDSLTRSQIVRIERDHGVLMRQLGYL